MTGHRTPGEEDLLAHRVLVEQVTLMCRLATVPLAGSVVIGAMVMWLTSPVHGAAVSATWYLVLLAVVAIRWQLARRYCKRERGPAETMRWRSWVIWMGALGGAVWSVAGTWLLPIGTVRETVVAVLFIGATASALNTHAPVRHAYSAMLVPFVLPFALYQLAMGGDRVIVGLAYLIYIPAMIVIANRQTGAIERQIRLTLENERLIAELRSAQERAELANRRLQEQVEQQHRSAEHIRALNCELEQQMTELRAANQDLEGFSYSVSHDLRAPLRAIDAFASLLEQQHPAVEPGARHYLGRIRANAARMSALIDDLLAFARCGRKVIEKRDVDMNQLVARALEELRGAHRTMGEPLVTVHTLPGAHGDPELLLQVWLNLLDNALKYSSRTEQPRIEIGGYERDDELVFEVSDNGIGFDSAHSDKLFGVFQRLHGGEEYPGTGVGLAIVQRIVTRHGGSVWASAAPNRGATFHFSLPKNDSSAMALAS